MTGGGWYIDEAGERFRHIAVTGTGSTTRGSGAWTGRYKQPRHFLTRYLFLELGLDTSLDYAFNWDLYARASM